MRRGQRDNVLAGQIGQYSVCSELGRLGYISTPFAGNVPAFDILAVDEHCHSVPIQVKTTRGNSWISDMDDWADIEFDPQTGIQTLIGPKAIPGDLIYVCVAIAKPGGKDRYFVLTMADLQKICIAHHRRWMEGHGWRRPRKPESLHSKYEIGELAPFENNWELITKQLVPAGAAQHRAAGAALNA
jgi:hypothetical protein